MSDDVKQCTTCGRNLTSDQNYAVFPCPGCTDTEIARCAQCKKQANTYECGECGFEGP